MARAEWAVTAAEHALSALRAINDARGTEADRAREMAGHLYWRLLFSVGTVPMNRLDDVYEASVTDGATVAEALDAIGA